MAKPKYRLTEKAYMKIDVPGVGMEDTLLNPEDMPLLDKDDPDSGRKPLIVEYEGRPGHHMIPVNEEAEAMFKKFPPKFLDPVRDMTVVVASDAQIASAFNAEQYRREFEAKTRIEFEVKARLEQEYAGKRR